MNHPSTFPIQKHGKQEPPKYLFNLEAWEIGITQVPILFRSMENRNHPSIYPIQKYGKQESPKYLSYLEAWEIGITQVLILFRSMENIRITQVPFLSRKCLRSSIVFICLFSIDCRERNFNASYPRIAIFLPQLPMNMLIGFCNEFLDSNINHSVKKSKFLTC